MSRRMQELDYRALIQKQPNRRPQPKCIWTSKTAAPALHISKRQLIRLLCWLDIAPCEPERYRTKARYILGPREMNRIQDEIVKRRAEQDRRRHIR